MDKIWKNSETGAITISSNEPTDGFKYTNETNIANWIGMMRKKSMSLAEVKQHIDEYVKNNQLNEYDNIWYEYYTNNVINNLT